jgi:hypothetical protein
MVQIKLLFGVTVLMPYIKKLQHGNQSKIQLINFKLVKLVSNFLYFLNFTIFQILNLNLNKNKSLLISKN